MTSMESGGRKKKKKKKRERESWVLCSYAAKPKVTKDVKNKKFLCTNQIILANLKIGE